MLSIQLTSTRNNLLSEDLTGIKSEPANIRPYRVDLLRLCREKSAAGLAANQVGLRENFFFLAETAKIPTSSGRNHCAHICINPTWKPTDKSTKVSGSEGCLSLPGRSFWAERESSILASWTNEVGHVITDKKLVGWSARVFQHEHDHLRGITLLQSGQPD